MITLKIVIILKQLNLSNEIELFAVTDMLPSK